MTRVFRDFSAKSEDVAKSLLGKFLVSKNGKTEKSVMITEVEVYDGFGDDASHARHKETKRNAPMWGKSGYWYVYFCYGVHWMLNLTTGTKGYPAAILIRGGITEDGIKIFGPGKLTKYLSVTGKLSGKTASRKSGLWIEDRGITISKKEIMSTPRIGISYASKKWRDIAWRFVWKGE